MLREPRKTVLSCGLGVDAVASARDIFSDAGIPTYDTPEDAVDAFMQMVSYRRNQELLMETPASSPVEFTPETGAVREAIVKVLGAGRDLLTEPEAKAVLAAYGIPVVDTRIAATADEAAAMATEIGLPVAVKVLSHDISHKSDVGGVVLDLETSQEVKAAVEAMGSTHPRYSARRARRRVHGTEDGQASRRPRANRRRHD